MLPMLCIVTTSLGIDIWPTIKYIHTLLKLCRHAYLPTLCLYLARILLYGSCGVCLYSMLWLVHAISTYIMMVLQAAWRRRQAGTQRAHFCMHHFVSLFDSQLAQRAPWASSLEHTSIATYLPVHASLPLLTVPLVTEHCCKHKCRRVLQQHEALQHVHTASLIHLPPHGYSCETSPSHMYLSTWPPSITCALPYYLLCPFLILLLCLHSSLPPMGYLLCTGLSVPVPGRPTLQPFSTT